MDIFNRVNSLILLLLLFFSVTTNPSRLFAETDIGNGKLFYCDNSSLFLTKNKSSVADTTARKKLKLQLNKIKNKIKGLPKSSKKRAKTVDQQKATRLALNEITSCLSGELEGTGIPNGTWNLTFENGLTPEQNGYNSLTLTIKGKKFTSIYDSSSLTCNWEGIITTLSESPFAVSVFTETASGGSVCNQAAGKTKTAKVTLTDDSKTLTLDYRDDGGALQVYEAAS